MIDIRDLTNQQIEDMCTRWEGLAKITDFGKVELLRRARDGEPISLSDVEVERACSYYHVPSGGKITDCGAIQYIQQGMREKS